MVFGSSSRLQKYVPDSVTVADEAASVLFILSSESSLHNYKNQLEKLFDYQIHHIIQIFIKNCDAMYTCSVMPTNGLTLRSPCMQKGVEWILYNRQCGGSLWATCIIVCASSSPSISISFIGFLIYLISISILLDNYVIINSKSNATQKIIISLLPFNYKTLRPLSPQNSLSFPQIGAHREAIVVYPLSLLTSSTKYSVRRQS